MQKERAIDLQFIRPIEVGTSAMKGKMPLRALFKEYLTKLSVGFYDPCCDNPATCPPISAQAGNSIQCNPDGLYVPPGGGGGGTLTSVGLIMPSAFSVTGSPVTTTGSFTIVGAGNATQYINGLGQLAILPVYNANNGITPSANIFQLGGPLIKDTFITNNGFRLSATNNTGVPTIQGNNSASGNGIEGNNTGTGNGVLGTAFSGVGGTFSSNSSFGVTAQSNTNIGLISSGTMGAQLTAFNGAVLNNSITILRLNRSTASSTPANGVGGAIDFQIYSSTLTDRISSSLISRWSDATDATRTAQFEIWNVNNTSYEQQLTLTGNGALRLNKYGIGAFTGVLTRYLAVDASGNVIESAVAPTNFFTSNTTNNINNINTGGVGIGTTMTNPTAYLHITGGTTIFPSLKFGSGSILTTPQDGAMEYDGVNLYFTIGSIRKIFPLGTTDTTIYTGDGNITGPRAINVQDFSVTWNNVGLFRIVEGDATTGGTYDFNDGVDFLAYNATNSANLVLNSVSGVSIEYNDVTIPALITSFVVDGTGIKMTNIDEYADNAAAIAGGLTAGYVYRTGDNLKIVH